MSRSSCSWIHAVIYSICLTKLGFRVMDALEPSVGMLQLAAKEELYRTSYNIGISAEPLPLPSDKYDPITICGWHGNTSSLADALPEMIRVVKPGGYICVVIRMDFVKDGDDYKDTYLRQCVKLAADDKWEQKQFTRFPSLITDVEGVKMMFKVC
ncbi:Williams-Beuren syndrome chromosomal region 27 protein-like isoform X2 [Mizuhopecten yessoensis]|uniref:Williams-Beuren syndrome chromosomal region 27 protein n=1 Tax=Mizuhopecten yessoensis TaxID=6573 RepID=A0A210PP08_MIZYE|nr:Williams-Beuren syndrome chromosomal region 27 protein-like isoform X2 [Mizuhopecten yessoensis]OWF38184.1 Williams-Beuren syndrome chromosomal region 27 protein [Mizuhopecten yessoensis]